MSEQHFFPCRVLARRFFAYSRKNTTVPLSSSNARQSPRPSLLWKERTAWTAAHILMSFSAILPFASTIRDWLTIGLFQVVFPRYETYYLVLSFPFSETFPFFFIALFLARQLRSFFRRIECPLALPSRCASSRLFSQV